jgi:hypothetical protein
MARPPARPALVAALVLLVSGLTAGTAVARDGSPDWWHWRHHGGGSGSTTSTTTTATTTAATTTTDTAPSATGTTTAATTPPAAATVPAPAAGANAGASTAPATPAPELDKTVALAATSGTVNVRRPGAASQPLTTTPQALPTGTRVDTRAGEVALTSAVDADGTTQTGRFSGGVFEVRAAAHGYTRLVLVGGHWAGCDTKATAARHDYVGARAVVVKATRKHKPIRSLWGSDDHGRFSTRGSGSVATVRGTRWLTEDSCAGTTTTVAKGAVDVRSRRTGRTTRVTAGHSLFIAR